MMPFGETVLTWRLARGLTQDALAQAARIPRPNLSAIERGDRDVTLRTLRALALALNVRPGVLVDGEGPEAISQPRLGRSDLERVAAAVAGGDRPRARAGLEGGEVALAEHLGAVTMARRDQPRRRAGGRKADRAYLLLRASQAPETIASLVDRIRVPARRLPSRGRP